MFELGNTLREARIRRRLDLMDAEADTKIRKKYLLALETEEFDILPGPVFTRGFLRTYANYLGLDGQLYLDEFNARHLHHDLHDDALLASVLTGRPRWLRVPGMRAILVASLLVLAVLSWFALHTATRDADHHTRAPKSIEGPSRAGAASTSTTQTATTPRAASRETTATAGDGQAHLRISAVHGSSWMQVQRGSSDGPILWAGMLRPGMERRFRSPRLVLTVGYPAAVLIRGGGQRLRPTDTTQQKFVVTPTGLRVAQ